MHSGDDRVNDIHDSVTILIILEVIVRGRASGGESLIEVVPLWI
jgi:hypothetical protein